LHLSHLLGGVTNQQNAERRLILTHKVLQLGTAIMGGDYSVALAPMNFSRQRYNGALSRSECLLIVISIGLAGFTYAGRVCCFH
jgi:hypothetical protein